MNDRADSFFVRQCVCAGSGADQSPGQSVPWTAAKAWRRSEQVHVEMTLRCVSTMSNRTKAQRCLQHTFLMPSIAKGHGQFLGFQKKSFALFHNYIVQGPPYKTYKATEILLWKIFRIVVLGTIIPCVLAGVYQLRGKYCFHIYNIKRPQNSISVKI
jgi:hypothetical protein